MSGYGIPMDLPNYQAALRDISSNFAPSRLAAVVSLSLAEDNHVQDAAEVMLQLLEDPVEEVRAQTVESLASLKIRNAQIDESHLISLLKDPSIEVRCALVESLSLFLNEPMAHALKASNDEHVAVRISATYLLSQLETKESVDRLIKMLDDEDEVVRKHAALSVGKDGAEKAKELLIKVVEDKDSETEKAIVLLSSFDTALPFMKTIMEDRMHSKDSRCIACASLVKFDDDDAKKRFTKYFSAFFKSTRQAILQASCLVPSGNAATLLFDFLAKTKKADEASIALAAILATDDKKYIEGLKKERHSFTAPSKEETERFLEELKG